MTWNKFKNISNLRKWAPCQLTQCVLPVMGYVHTLAYWVVFSTWPACISLQAFISTQPEKQGTLLGQNICQSLVSTFQPQLFWFKCSSLHGCGSKIQTLVCRKQKKKKKKAAEEAPFCSWVFHPSLLSSEKIRRNLWENRGSVGERAAGTAASTMLRLHGHQVVKACRWSSKWLSNIYQTRGASAACKRRWNRGQEQSLCTVAQMLSRVSL